MDNTFNKIPLFAPFRIHYTPEATSTNDLAHERCYTHGDIIVADSQSKGRGQRGNSWESQAGANLIFSLVIEPNFLAAGQQFSLSQVISLAVSDTLSSYGITSCVKWPNDIYIGDKKTAGILIENEIMNGVLSRSIAGIGLNVNQSLFSPALPNPISMFLATGKEFDRGEVLASFLKAFAARYSQLETGQTSALESEYYDRLYLADTPHCFRLPDGQILEGSIREVGPCGELIIETDNGDKRSFLFKEIIF